jgi:spore germination protein KC
MRELNEIGMVMSVAIDKSKSDNGEFEVTVELANPSSKTGNDTEGGIAGKVWISSAKGLTVFEAIRNLSKVASKRIMWAHNNLIIVGEELARNDITAVMDFFTHSPELRMKTWITVSYGEAKPYLKAKIGSGDIPGLEISKLFRYQMLAAKSVDSEMLNIYTDFCTDHESSLISGVSLSKVDEALSGGEKEEKNMLKLEGAAVFSRSKMKGWLSENETRGINWAMGKTEDTIISVKTSEEQNSAFAVETHNVKSKIDVDIKEGKPHFIINITGEGNITEEDRSSFISMEELKNKLEELVNNKIKEDITLGLKKVQKDYNSDVLDLGQILNRKNNKEWKEKLHKEWEEIYPSVPVQVIVNIDIKSSTLNQIPANYR